MNDSRPGRRYLRLDPGAGGDRRATRTRSKSCWRATDVIHEHSSAPVDVETATLILQRRAGPGPGGGLGWGRRPQTSSGRQSVESQDVELLFPDVVDLGENAIEVVVDRQVPAGEGIVLA